MLNPSQIVLPLQAQQLGRSCLRGRPPPAPAPPHRPPARARGDPRQADGGGPGGPAVRRRHPQSLHGPGPPPSGPSLRIGEVPILVGSALCHRPNGSLSSYFIVNGQCKVIVSRPGSVRRAPGPGTADQQPPPAQRLPPAVHPPDPVQLRGPQRPLQQPPPLPGAVHGARDPRAARSGGAARPGGPHHRRAHVLPTRRLLPLGRCREKKSPLIFAGEGGRGAALHPPASGTRCPWGWSSWPTATWTWTWSAA